MTTSFSSNDLRNAKFNTAFRGYDPTEVRAFLVRIAGLIDVERAEAETVVVRVAEIETPTMVATSMETSFSGDVSSDISSDVTQIIDAARNEANVMMSSARNDASAIVAKANDEAARIILRARAESRGRPTSEGSAVVEAAYADSPNDPQLAKEQARMMISEARAVRERILSDLAKRRRVAHVQLEQLRVAREKLQESLREARRIVDDAARDMSTAEVEARLAAETAGRRVSGEPLPSAADLETELWGGRHVRASMVAANEEKRHELAEMSDEVGSPDLASPGILATESDEDHDGHESTAIGLVLDCSPVAEPTNEIARTEDRAQESVDVESEIHAEPLSGEVDAADLADAADEHRPKKKTANVEELFARLRSEREASAANARAVLADHEASTTDGASEATTDDGRDSGRKHSLPGSTAELQARATDSVAMHTASIVLDLRGDDSSEPSVGEPSGGDAGDHPVSPNSQFISAQASSVSVLSPTTKDIAVLQLVDEPVEAQLDLGMVSQRSEETESEELAFVIGPLQSSLVRTVKRRLHDEQSAALANLRMLRGPADVVRLVGEEHAQRQRLTAELLPLFVDAFKVGADRSHRAVDDATITSVVEPAADEIAGSVTSVIRAELEAALAQVPHVEGEARPVNDAIASCYRSWTTERIGQVVDGRLQEAFALGIAS